MNKELFKNRIEKLQKTLNGKSFLLNRTDMFRGEYLSPHDERVKWLCGFTGSNACVFFNDKEVYLFTDGRYLLQAEQEIPSFINIVDVSKYSAFNFVIKNLKNTLLLDPWLTSVSQVYEFEKRGVKIELLNENPVDLMWEDQPKQPTGEVFKHDIKYCGQTSIEKKKRLIKDLDGKTPFLITDSENVCWLLNIRGSDLSYTPTYHCYAIVYSDKIDVYSHGNIEGHKKIYELNKDLKKIEKIYSDTNRCPYKIKKSCNVIHATDPIYVLKSCKNESEIQGAKKAHKKDSNALKKFRNWLYKEISSEKLSEKKADEYLIKFRSEEEDFKTPSFPSIVGCNENGAIIHYRVSDKTNKKIKKDDVLLVDSGGQYLDGTTDITRVYYFGKNPPKKLIELYTLVFKGLIALSDAIFPVGTSGAQLDILARQFIWRNGLDYAHGTGHGVGSYLNVHEGPQGISKSSTFPLMEGMIVSIEPGVYLENEFGIRLENLAFIKKHPSINGFLCFETLTCVPFESNLIDKSLLSKKEIDYFEIV